MALFQTLPFTVRRSSDAFSTSGFTTTKETTYGLLRIEGDSLVIQWRLARKTERFGATEFRTDEEFESVREVTIPLKGVAGALVRRRWWHWLTGPQIVLRASDLQAFEPVTGEEGMRLEHPAELVLRLRRSDILVAREFAAELELAVAQRMLDGPELDAMPPRESDPPERLSPPGQT